MGGRGASSNRNSRMNFKLKKDVITDKGEVIPKGTLIKNVIEIAGGKRNKPINEISNLVKQYGGNEKDWSKRRGTVIIDGEKKELHYYQNDKIGKVKFKFKR